MNVGICYADFADAGTEPQQWVDMPETQSSSQSVYSLVLKSGSFQVHVWFAPVTCQALASVEETCFVVSRSLYVCQRVRHISRSFQPNVISAVIETSVRCYVGTEEGHQVRSDQARKGFLKKGLLSGVLKA